MLYPYQEEGVRWLVNQRRAYLADEMGLGKTVQAIVAAREQGLHDVWIVCPASVVENWKREWEAWGGLGEPKVISYSKLIRHPPFVGVPQLVILDESHYCKSPSAKRTKAALRLAASAERAWLLSGTPVPNNATELYPAVKALWPEIVPPQATKTARAWLERYCNFSDTDYGPRVWGNKPTVKSELVPALRRIMLRRRLDEVALDLPPLRITVQYLDKDPNLAEDLTRLGAKPEDEEHMSTLRRLLGQYKAPKVANVLRDELADGTDMVVLYHHLRTGEQLATALGAYYGFHGGTPADQRQREIDGFQKNGGLFLAQQGAAGTGITLTRASEIVLVEPSWSPAENDQAIKRIHRIGQDRPCRARLFAVPDSLDAALMATLTRKERMVAEVTDG